MVPPNSLKGESINDLILGQDLREQTLNLYISGGHANSCSQWVGEHYCFKPLLKFLQFDLPL